MASTLVHKQPITIDRVYTQGTAKLLVTHEHLTEEDGSQTLDWETLVAEAFLASSVPANARVMWCHANLLEVFAGGAVSAATLSLGITGALTGLLNAINVFTGQDLGIKVKNGAYTLGTFEADYTAKITVATTDGNVADLTTGKIELFIEWIALETASLLQ